jgi:hypothetical protein
MLRIGEIVLLHGFAAQAVSSSYKGVTLVSLRVSKLHKL